MVQEKASTGSSLDEILIQIGDFGKYQKIVFGLFSFAVILHSMVHIAFVFSALDINYRCEIPECEEGNLTEYNPKWLTNAVPYVDNLPEKCQRFKPFEPHKEDQKCSSTDFDRSALLNCSNYVFETPEVTIAHDFDLFCADNLWKLTIVGTVNNVGQFVGMPIGGYLSDRYGRRFVLVWGMILAGISGIIRAFSTSYLFFVVFEFLDATFGASTYACGFILGVELVGPKKRVLSGTIVSCCYAVGEVLVALIAMWLKNWRYLLFASYIPPLLLLSYLWITPESVRWLISQGRLDEAKAILKKAAKVNKSNISEEMLNKIAVVKESSKEQVNIPISDIFKSWPLMLRFINCCFCWITCTFLFYGLTLNSVALAGNPYLDFILTALAEVPGYIITYLTMDRFGRRYSQCLWYLITGISCLLAIAADSNWHGMQLFIYIFGKFGATSAFTVLYVLTSEMFPTSLRHSMLGACSMIGRIGSMVSPQMPLLKLIWKPFPFVLFGLIGIIAGLLSLLFPETLNTKLPDTIEEAENIGKKK